MTQRVPLDVLFGNPDRTSGHGFARLENGLDFYEHAERFLAEHLPA